MFDSSFQMQDVVILQNMMVYTFQELYSLLLFMWTFHTKNRLSLALYHTN